MSNVFIRAASYDDMYYLRGRFGVSSSWIQDQLFHVAVEKGGDGHIVGYVQSIVKKETNEETNECKIYAEISNVLVAIGKLGIATKLVTAAHKDLKRNYHPEYVSAVVPRSNFPAYILFQKTLEYNIHGADIDNNAYILRKQMHYGGENAKAT